VHIDIPLPYNVRWFEFAAFPSTCIANTSPAIYQNEWLSFVISMCY